MFRFGTVWSLPLVFAVLLLLSGLGTGFSPSMQGLVDLAGIASVCLIVPWLLRFPVVVDRKHWLVLLSAVIMTALQISLPGIELTLLPAVIRHLLTFIFVFCSGIIIWVMFQVAGRGKRGLWWLRSIFISGVYVCLVLFNSTPGLWLLFTIPAALLLLTFRPLKAIAPWKLSLIMVGALLLFIFLLAESHWSGSQLLSKPWIVPGVIHPASIVQNIIDSARFFIMTVAAMLVVRIALHGVFGIYSPNIRVRTKLTLTVLFSSVIPGILVLLIVTLGVAVIAGGYCASLVKSMLMDRVDDLECWLTSIEDPVSLARGMKAPGSGALEKAALDIFEIVDSDTEAVWLKQVISTSEAGFGDSLKLAWAVIEQGKGHALTKGALHDYALRQQENYIAILHCPIDREVLNNIKSIVGVDIELFRPTIPIGDTSDVIVGYDGSQGSFTTRIGGEENPVSFVTPSVINTEVSIGHQWTEQSFYFGMNYLSVMDFDHWDSTEPINYVAVVRTSLQALYNTIFSQTNTMNRVTFRVFLVMTFIFLVTMAFIWGTGVFVARSISSGAAKLVKGTQRLRQGDLDVQIPLSSRDELGEVATSFNLMAGDLKRMMKDMAEKERMEQELAIARSIQLKLLPKEIPRIPGIDVYGISEPAREVGGDCYDILLIDDNRLVLSIGDVSGKGMAAALLMANLQASLRMLAIDKFTPKSVIRRLNESLCQNIAPGMFVTYFLAMWDHKQGKLHYVNAGHDYPLIARDGIFESLTEGGMVMGVDPKAEYLEATVKLQPGNWLIMYSDGIIDARDSQGRYFDVDKFQKLIQKHMHRSAKEVVTSSLIEVKEFSKDPTYDDDRTLVAFHVMDNDK